MVAAATASKLPNASRNALQLMNDEKLRVYSVTADHVPFKSWTVEADSAIEARRIVAEETGIPFHQLDAVFERGAK